MYTPLTSISDERRRSIDCLAFSPDGAYLASGDESGMLVISSVPTGEEVDKFLFFDSIAALVWEKPTRMFVGLANCELHILHILSLVSRD
jgi:WD40 repeat protein